jgi:hypothetical protein
MRLSKAIAIAMVALLAGGIISQTPTALGDASDNPFNTLWDAIFDLQSRDDDLQAQIDELRAEKNVLLAHTGAAPVFVSDLYAELEVETTEDGHTLVHVTAGNSGPDRAAGVKLTVFYLMPLFEINSINGDLCEDKSRGIIECVLGTLEADQESVVTIHSTAKESGKANIWTVDISTTTHDADYTNNHVDYNFETGSDNPIGIPEVEQPEEEIENETSDETEAEPEPEQNDSSSNSTSTEVSEDDTGKSSSEEGSSSQESVDNAAEQEGQDNSSSETGEEQEQSGESGNDESSQDESQESGSSEESGSEGSESSESGENGNERQQQSNGDESSEQVSDDSGSEGSSESGSSGQEHSQ